MLAGAQTSLAKLVVTGGDQPSGPDGYGGGIRSDADVVIRRGRIVGNRTVSEDGGGIAFPEGEASLRLARSVVARNFSGDDGGGVSFDEEGPGRLVIDRTRIVANRSADWGGGFITAVTARITRTTIALNRALTGNGGGGAIEEPDNSVVRDSTFSGNAAGFEGGGLVISSEADGSRVINTTVSGNRGGDEGGGVWISGSQVRLNAVTVARNSTADSGGGIGVQGGTAFVRNSLIALNSAALPGPDCGGDPLASLGNNLVSSASGCAGLDRPGDRVRSSPRLGKLRNNGGPTQTIALLKRSPAIGKAHRPSAPKRDQRGRKRDRKPDVGAFER